MKILIADKSEHTLNYQNAMQALGAQFCCTLSLEGVEAFDGLLLPGGGDVDPTFLNEENKGSTNIDIDLDMAQFALLSEFVNSGKPVLGICRGHQVINVYFGGGLIQDLGEVGNATHRWEEATGDKVHQTTAVPGSFVATLYGEAPFATNSAHHQGLAKLGSGLVAAQFAADGVNEAIYHECLPIYGVQWHPERMCFEKARTDTVDGSKVLAFFLQECARVQVEQAQDAASGEA